MNEGHVWSPSQVEAVEKCPRQFAYRYVERRKSKLPRGVEAYMGTRVHAIAERAEHHYALHGVAASLDAMLATFRREWAENLPAAGLHVAKRGMKVADYLEIGERCVRNLAGIVPLAVHHPDARVIGLEVPLNFTVGGFPFFSMALAVPFLSLVRGCALGYGLARGVLSEAFGRGVLELRAPSSELQTPAERAP